MLADKCTDLHTADLKVRFNSVIAALLSCAKLLLGPWLKGKFNFFPKNENVPFKAPAPFLLLL